MKTTSILTLISLAVLATQASAASAQSEATVVVLPTYVVQVPLAQPAEQKVQASLNELRQQARTMTYAPVAMPMVKITPVRSHLLPLAALTARDIRVASL